MTVTPDTSILERMLASSAFGDFIKNYNLALAIMGAIDTIYAILLSFIFRFGG